MTQAISLRALCVARSEKAGRVLSSALEVGGIDVVTVAHRAEDALAAVECGCIDFVIIEDGAPDMDGVSLCGELRDRSRNSDASNDPIPVLIALQEPDRNRMLDAFRAGASDVISPPVTPEKFYGHIERIRTERHRILTC